MWARTGLWVSTAICFCKCSSFPMISCLWWTPRNSLSITDGNKSNLHFLIDVLPLIMRSADPWRSLFGSSEGNLLFCLIAVHRKLFCWNMTAATRNSCCHSIKAAESSFLQCLVHGCQLVNRHQNKSCNTMHQFLGALMNFYLETEKASIT